MRRREVIGIAAGALVWPFATQAQRARGDKLARIATIPDLGGSPTGDWFIAAMLDQGWKPDRDFVVVQSAIQPGQINLDEAIARVIAKSPDVIFAGGVSIALSARRTSTTIPIVMWVSGHPVEAGLADSFAKPGKNVTGNALYVGTEIWSKLLQLLREAKPDIARVGVLWSYVPPTFPKEEVEPAYFELREAERALGLMVHIVEAATADQLPAALAEIDARGADALLLTSNLHPSVRPAIMEFAIRKSLPTVSDFRWRVGSEVLPLLSYGGDFRDLIRSAVVSVIKILQGERPGDMPIQRPARFEMILNLKTAKAIGLTVPQSILMRADEVIE